MSGREPLKKGQTLTLYEPGSSRFQRSFTIGRVISDRGASVICYEAYHENSGKGVLKEFYPQNAYSLERGPDGQLTHTPGLRDGYERFRKLEGQFREPYETLLAIRRGGGDPDVATFIPAFELYRSGAGEGEGTIYVWTPEPELEPFDSVCREIHRHPTRDPERKLVTVLAAIDTLTRCTCALHAAELLHRDINPKNFGFIRRGSQTLTQTLSMFDVNSICSVYDDCDVMGTEGYLEPEAMTEFVTNQTDIYAIGATLFHAIIITDETKAGRYLYEPAYHDRLREMVDASKLIQASEANSHPRLRRILTTILQKCLCERSGRYRNCEQLLHDLEIALYYALPSGIAGKKVSGERWILADAEKALDCNQDKNSFLSIQYHLYEHPLYRYSPPGDEKLRVLVIGFGNYGQKFLDACLQNGQMPGKRLEVTVVSDDMTDGELYLSERPELEDFFDIGGSRADGDHYGSITFVPASLAREDPAANAGIMQDIMCTQAAQYVFVALGDDGLNRSAAAACRVAAEVLEQRCVVSYICEGPEAGRAEADLHPLCVNRDIRELPLHPEIERMAFNAHLVWEKHLNADRRAVRAYFRRAYNHDACVSNVLSLRYKLYSMGIDLAEVSFDEAAALYREKLTNALRNELIWVEHRRWVTEKLCLGWRRIRDLSECAGGVTKDARRKRHICIVRSRPEQTLAAKYQGNHFAKWDTATEAELDKLDELDRLSVELHRMYRSRAAGVQAQSLLSGELMTGIRTLIDGSGKAAVAFQEWFSCVKDIAGNENAGEKVYLYKGLKQAFLDAAQTLPVESRNAVQEQVAAFDAVFYPVWASMEYRDWKQDDVALIDSIPFVLTYTENIYLAIPYATGDSDRAFGNVAAATVVDPERILYLYLIEQAQDIRALLDSVPGVMGYMDKKKLRAGVDFVLVHTRKMTASIGSTLEEELRTLGGGRLRQVKWICLEEITELPRALEAYLRSRCTGKKLFALEKNRTPLSLMLQVAHLCERFPSYRFLSESMRFEEAQGCAALSYIRKLPYITVADMMAFQRSSSKSSDDPEFFGEHRQLWAKYRENSSLWKGLCQLLARHAEANDVIASFRRTLWNGGAENEYHYILPVACSRSARKIVDFLLEKGVVRERSRVDGHTTATCRVTIVESQGVRGAYDRLFSNVYALMAPEELTLKLDTVSHEVSVAFDTLLVSGLRLPAERRGAYLELLRFFAGLDHIIGLTVAPDDSISFTYASREIKAMLTTAGRILEIHTYHKAKELGRFDDVVCGYEINWEDTEVRSECDCILTRGFRSLFVECKARSEIDQDFYFKLAALAQRFGINATAVLIADTQEKSGYDNVPINAMQRSRGRMLGVVTVWRPEEIDDIGTTLWKIMNGKYKEEQEHV